MSLICPSPPPDANSQGAPGQQHTTEPTDRTTPTRRQQVHDNLPREALQTVAVTGILARTPPRLHAIESRSAPT